MFLALETWIAWLISHLIENSFISIDGFSNNILTLIIVQYWSCNFIFDTSIWYDQDSVQVRYGIIKDFVKKI